MKLSAEELLWRLASQISGESGESLTQVFFVSLTVYQIDLYLALSIFPSTLPYSLFMQNREDDNIVLHSGDANLKVMCSFSFLKDIDSFLYQLFRVPYCLCLQSPID